MIIIMQRLNADDLVGFLLKGNGADKYHWLNIPAILEEDTGSKEWYEDITRKHAFTHAIPIEYSFDMRGKEQRALWPSRIGLEILEKLKETDPFTFWSQYMGDPTAKGLGIIDEEWFVEYEPEDLDKEEIMRTFIVVDTASTTKTYSDYSVLGYFGMHSDGSLYLLDITVGKWETPELMKKMHNFWNKHNKLDMTLPRWLPNAMYIEDKSSGHYILQQIIKTGNIHWVPIPRDKTQGDKLARFMNVVPFFAQRRLKFPKGHEHIDHVRREILGRTQLVSGTGHDDVIDVVTDAVSIAFSANQTNYGGWV